jgi:branched-subunit amino acid aminotransferase/4-amino-4-deoxychorismate lyase
MRVIKGKIFAWEAHLTRLQQGVAAFGLACPEGLLPSCLEAAQTAGEDALLRLTLSGGQAPRGLIPDGERQVAVHIQVWPYHPASEPLTLRSVHWPLTGMSRIAKFTADYAFTIRLLHQARHAGLLGQNEQALFTRDDEILCMETANILLLVNGEWLTPDTEAALQGVVRQALLESSALRACRCPVDWLLACDAMAICNSGSFIRPVASVNGRRLDVHPDRFTILLDVLRGRQGVPEHLL